MSGTSYGACVPATSPRKSFVGGPLAFVRNGDLIELNVEKRELNLKISAEELQRRKKAAGKAPARKYERSYGAIFSQHVKQARRGLRLRLPRGDRAPVPDPEIH